jgi:hypothetical protein
VRFLKEHPQSRDLYQGPMLCDNLRDLYTHFQPVWSAGMYGVWANDERAADPQAPPFEIPMQGLGVFACRRDAWPGLNPRMSGFGGEEGYIHEKIRRQGGAVCCLPFLRWLHRFERPNGVPYAPSWKDRIRNYLIAYDELGLDPRPVVEHFEAFLGIAQAGPLLEAARREIAGPFHSFDAVYGIAEDADRERWNTLALETKMRFVAAPGTPSYPEIGRVLAHRTILEEANSQALGRVLVFDTYPGSLDDIQAVFRGDSLLGRRVPGAAAYCRPVFSRLLTAIPSRAGDVALWLRKEGGFDAYLARAFGES